MELVGGGSKRHTNESRRLVGGRGGLHWVVLAVVMGQGRQNKHTNESTKTRWWLMRGQGDPKTTNESL